jgi:CubicO group peptidase (beta-lactamase class C family)
MQQHFTRLLLAIVAVAVLSAQSMPALSEALRAKVDALAAAEFAKDGHGGATVAVVKGASVAWVKGYGVADIESRTPASADTIYRIGSITKPFTAVMLLQLAERGTVRLTDPVEKYLPEIARIADRPAGTPPVTLLQVATMTAGIGREPADLDKFLVGPAEQWEQVMLQALERTKYVNEPGTRFFYSNIGYAMLGAALGRAAGRPYIDYMRDQVLAPLGMTHSDFVPSAAIRPALAKGYEVRNGKPDGAQAAREHDGRGYKVPNGALYTTAGDLAKFVSLWLGEGPESVVKRATIKEALSRVSSASAELTSGYGIGFQANRNGTLVTYGHGGSVAGYRAQMTFHPPTKTGVIVLRNVGGGQFSAGSLASRILAALVEAGS